MAIPRTSGRLKIGALIAVAVLTLAACNRETGDEAPPEAGDVAVARVEGQTVWASDVKREAAAQGLIGEGEPLDQQSDLFRRVLDEVVDQKLLAAEAVNRGLDSSLTAQRRLDAARERVLGDMLVESVVEKAVNDSAIRGLYQEQLKLSRQSEEIRARQIMVQSQADGEAIKKLLTAGASFDALAMERSSDAATRFNGGDLGYFTLDVMPDAYGVALKDVAVGQIVGPFQTEGGWVVLRVEDKRIEEPITLEAARPQIVRFLTYDQVRDLLERLRSAASIQNLLPRPTDVPGAPREPASAPPLPPGATDPQAAPAATPPAAPAKK
jgi:peptidyl-prolyl cis-trans isomerase C